MNERVSALEKDNSALLQLTDKIDELKSTNSHLKEDIISKEKETSICIEKITLFWKENEWIPPFTVSNALNNLLICNNKFYHVIII